MILSGYEALFFWIFALAAIFAALLTVMARNAVHSALFLISSLVSVAALFVLAGAEFIAKLGIVEEEADESAFWLELIIEGSLLEAQLVESLLNEANELARIMASSRITAGSSSRKLK